MLKEPIIVQYVTALFPPRAFIKKHHYLHFNSGDFKILHLDISDKQLFISRAGYRFTFFDTTSRGRDAAAALIILILGPS